VLGLVGAAIVAAAVSGIGGTLGFVLFHDATTSVFVTWGHEETPAEAICEREAMNSKDTSSRNRRGTGML
jgi:hypothetical protein